MTMITLHGYSVLVVAHNHGDAFSNHGLHTSGINSVHQISLLYPLDNYLGN